MGEYQYKPLSATRQIRLLKLYAGAESDELSGELVQASLDEAPSFIALSYVWGNPKPRKSICCYGREDGLQVEIGSSLHSALQHIREPNCETLLWADALCINQKDIPERTQQVKMMGDIYAAARCTILWLGENSVELRMAFGWLRRFAIAWQLLESNPPVSRNDSEFIAEDQAETMLQVAFGRNRTAAFRHIWALLDRPWFTRKWIIQELVKSRVPFLVSGKNLIPWACLADWITFLHRCPAQKNLFMVSCARPLEAGPMALEAKILRATLLRRIAGTEKQILLFLLARTLEFRCGDPRDHVFALVGIASDADQFDLIDYGSPIENVCRQLAHACVSNSMSLKLLWSLIYLAPLKRRVHSWVPNLDNLVADSDGSIVTTQFSVQQDKDYSASGDSVLEAGLDDGGNMLMIRGRIVDKLQRLGSDSRSLGNAAISRTIPNKNIHTFGKNLRKIYRQRYQWLEECLAITKTMSNTNGEEAFQNALLSDHLINEEFPQSLALVRSEFSLHLRLMKAAAYDDDSWLSAAMTHSNQESSYLLESMIMEKLQRRFGRTVNGRIGWLPPVAEEGDLICVFNGMELPYAVRPTTDGRYLLVGEAIIMGLMMGEGMQLPHVESETIVLV